MNVDYLDFATFFNSHNRRNGEIFGRGQMTQVSSISFPFHGLLHNRVYFIFNDSRRVTGTTLNGTNHHYPYAVIVDSGIHR